MAEVETIQCYECNKDVAPDLIKEVHGNDWCQDCISEFAFTCTQCDNLFHNDDIHNTVDGKVCESCHEEYSRCERCERYDDDISEVSGQIWCRRCADTFSVACHDCDILVSESLSYCTDGGNYLCESCYCDNYFSCENCSDVFHNDEYHDGYCRSCSNEEGDGLVHNYSDNPLDYVNFMGNPKDKLYYGVELEVNVKNGAIIGQEAQKTLDLLGTSFVMLKEDGSIGHGFEICSAPATIEVHHKKWDRFLDNLPRLNSWSSGQCGIHVHISRNGLSQLDVGKMVVFVNDPNNMEFIKAIAGRYSTGYCNIDPGKKISSGGEGRYEAINLMREDTIEIRIFRGTLNKVHFYSNLEFCEALVKFVKTHGIMQLNKELFIRSIGRKIHPNLHEFLTQKGFIERRTKVDVPDNQQSER